ncbi:MAG TPA: hypothetical protein VJ834_15925 [Burkholderiales bacterium]|nr:hypothetical protein [Burkholderiales bacterium]
MALITIGAALIVYLFTRNRRYLRFAWRAFQFTVIFAVVVMAFYVVERLLLAV